MKLIKLLILLQILFSSNAFSQNNFISNPGFEIGKPNRYPLCEYCPGSSCFGCNNTYIDTDIQDWWQARCTNIGCDYKRSFPDWMNSNCGSTTGGMLYNTNFVYLEKKQVGDQDAIRNGLNNTMNPSKNYI